MARTAMSIRQRPAQWATAPLDISAFDTFDNVNGMTFPADGVTLLLFYVPTGGPFTVTLHSGADPLGRTGDITAYSVATGHVAIFQEFPTTLWNSGGFNICNVDASGAIKYLAVQRSPGT